MTDDPKTPPSTAATMLAQSTLLAQAGQFIDAETRGLVPPIHTSTTYARDANYELPDNRMYLRDDNPLFEHAEEILSTLEGGADAALFSSGLAAMSAVVATLSSDDRVVLSRQCYFGVRNWLGREAERVGFTLDMFDASVAGSLEQALAATDSKRPATLVWIESPSNPLWTVMSIEDAAKAAHGAGAKLVVDATVMTPLICQALSLGADIVMHSATKYLNGHADVLAGALVTAEKDDRWQAIRDVRYHSGAVLGPFEAWLLIRGMRTMHLRVRESCRSAMAIAQHFEGHPKLRQVIYPGLESHPGHEIARREWNTDVGFTGMLSIRLDADADGARKFAASTRLFKPATSLGGVESLIEHRHTIEEGKSDVPDDLIRLSVGIEDVNELIADLGQALAGL